MAPTIVWTHGNTPMAGEDGIAWQSASTPFGRHAISGGGYAETLRSDNQTSTDEFGVDASGLAPLAASRMDYDSGTDTTYWHAGFAAPPGTILRYHIFVVLAEEV